MKKRFNNIFKLFFLCNLLILVGCKDDHVEKNSSLPEEVEQRSSEDHVVATPGIYYTDPTDRVTIESGGKNYIISKATFDAFELANDSFFVKSYAVGEASWSQEAYEKVFHLISRSEWTKDEEMEFIASYLNNDGQINTGFSGAIAVLDKNLNPEQVQVYGNDFLNMNEEDVAYRIEHVATSFDGPDAIEERNAGGCFAIYLVEYGLVTGAIYNSWLVGFFCVGTGPGGGNSPVSTEPSGGGTTSE